MSSKSQMKKIRFMIMIALIMVFSVSCALCLWAIVNKFSIGKINSIDIGQNKQEHQSVAPEGYEAITTADQLQNISVTGKYILMNDIDLSNTTWQVIGTSSTPFKGILDGNYYTIRNMNIESQGQYVGMFGYINNGATIKNVTLENVTVKSTYTTSTSYVGILSGCLYSSNTTVENVTITGTSKVEENSEKSNTIYIGGAIGYISGGEMTNVNSNANVTVISTSGQIYAGGLVGDIQGGTINKTYTTGKVTANTKASTIYAGGLVGYSYRSGSSTLSIQNSYSTAIVEATSTSGQVNAGGLIGKANGSSNYWATLSKTYAIGKVTAETTGTKNVGGLVGATAYTSISSSYYSPETTEQITSAAGTGTLFCNMLQQHLYSNWDWDSTWAIEENNLPYLKEMGKPSQVNKQNYQYIDYKGEGTEENPYIITTEEQLRGIKYDLSLHYKLENNIILSNTTWEVLGTSSTPFKGTLDGNNCTISNIRIESQELYIGMFGYLNDKAIIKNLTLKDVTVTSTCSDSTSYTGIVAGYLQGSTVKIENVKVTGNSKVKQTIEGSNARYIGGLVGYSNSGTITNANTTGNIEVTSTSGQIYVGGLAGMANSGTITNVSSNSDVNATSTSGSIYSGGLIGLTSKGNITNANANGNVKANANSNYSYAGALIGRMNEGTLNKAYSTGKVITNTQTYGATYIGGLIGEESSTASGSANISNSYSLAEVEAISTSGQIYAGGLIGRINGSKDYTARITNTYAVGEVTAETTGAKNIGGLVGGINYSSTISSYYSPETTKQLTSAAGTATLFFNMLSQNLYKSWDFATVWTIEEGNSLPSLKEIEKPTKINKENYEYIQYEGKGTEENPYIIKTEQQLKGIKYDLTLNYKLGNSINLSNDWEIIATFSKPFRGTLDGDNYTISNLNIESNEQYVGMFGYVNGATIKNIKLENVTVTGNNSTSNSYVGVLAGYVNSSTIENINITSENEIKASTEDNNGVYIGSLTGYAGGNTITDINVDMNIKGTTKGGKLYVGGLIGYTTSNTITSSKTSCNVEATSTSGIIYAGSLVGQASSGSITNSNPSNKTSITIISTSGTIYAGGLIGESTAGANVTNCYSNSNINATSTSGTIYEGGLIGRVYTGTINKTYATGKIIANTEVNTIRIGGLIGEIGITTSISTSLSNSYSLTEVEATSTTGTIDTGGLIGASMGISEHSIRITNTYAVGKVIAETSRTKNTGGLIGHIQYSYATSSYYSPETIKQYTSALGTAVFFQDMLYKKLYQNWDFNTIWSIDEGSSLPYLTEIEKPEEIKEQNYEYRQYQGEGTEENPYIITTEEELQDLLVLQTIKGKAVYSKLGNDITITKKFEPIGNKTIPFMGVLDGDNHSIKNMQIESQEQYVGIFGYVNGGTIKDVTLENMVIKSTCTNQEAYIGGLAGYTENATIRGISIIGTSSIENTEAENTVYIGSLVGYHKGTIKYSHSNANINVENTKKAYVGGLVGTNEKRLQDSYYEGTITGQSENSIVGGIAGKNTQRIRKTYAIGSITLSGNTMQKGGIAGENTGTIFSSYWNLENILQDSLNGTYQTLDNLKQQSTYKSWNFESVWRIEEGVTTPILDMHFENVEYYQHDYWEWHTRTTTEDKAYNGEHIQIIDDTFNFLGYGNISYKDFLYKHYQYAGKKVFHFVLDETQANYHTLEGAGFIFNSSIKDNRLSGYILLYSQNKIGIYRVQDIDVNTFETQNSSTIVSTYSSQTIVEVQRNSEEVFHDIIVEVTPTSVRVIDNDKELINQLLDYTKHAGESFGLIASYISHDCSQLTKIVFEDFYLEINDYIMYVIKTDENGTPLKGANFQVKDAEGEKVREGQSDNNGIFQVKGLQEGNYTVEETQAPTGYIKQTSQKNFKFTNDGKVINPDTQEDMTIKFVNKAVKVELTKLDKESKQPIKGAKFGLFDDESAQNAVMGENNQAIEAVSDESGKVILKGFNPGTYYCKEIEAAIGYKNNQTIYKIIVDDKGNVTFENNAEGVIYNEKILKDVTIKKTGQIKDSQEVKFLPGATITLYDAKGTQIQEKVTDEEGKVTFENLTVGTYSYKETQAPRGYELNNRTYRFTVNQDETVTFTEGNEGIIHDTLETIKVDVTIKKHWLSIGRPLRGAIIGLYDEEGEEILNTEGNPVRAITDEYGIAKFVGLKPGIYQYREITAPNGYYINANMYKVIVNDDGTIDYGTNNGIIYDARKQYGHWSGTGSGSGSESGGFGGRVKVQIGGSGITGGSLTLETDDSGNVKIPDLAPGRYTVTVTDEQGNTHTGSLVVGEDGSYGFSGGIEGNFHMLYGDLIQITITKRRAGVGTLLYGATIELYDRNGNVVGRATTNTLGRVTFSGLKPGVYYYKEVIAPNGYYIDSNRYQITVRENGTIDYGTHNGVIYDARKQYVHWGGHGTGTGGSGSGSGSLGGGNFFGGRVKVEIEVAGGTGGTGGTGGYTTFETDTFGNGRIPDLPVGRHHVTVTDGNGNQYTGDIVVDEYGNYTFEGDIQNDFTLEYGDIITVEITKMIEGTDIVLEGAIIELYDESGHVLARATTNREGKAIFSGLKPGTIYQYKEGSAPTGYVLNGAMYRFQVDEEGNIIDIVGNRIIYNARVAITGDLVITKKGANTDIVLQGAVIGVFSAENDQVVQTETTNENGQITFKGLEPGEYYYKEITAPNRYQINEEKYYFTVQEDGSILFQGNTNGIIYDELIGIDLPIYKIDAITHAIIQGAKLGIYDQDGNLLAEGITDENGCVVFHNLVLGRTYQYKEIEPPSGYVLDSTMYTFTITDNDNIQCTGQIIEIDGIQYIALYNQPIQPEWPLGVDVTIYKKDSITKRILQGAVIGLYDTSGNAIIIDGKAITATTDASGKAIFKGLKPGTYQYKEEIAPNGYRLNENIYTFTVKEDGSILFHDNTEGILYDELIGIDLPIYKIDAITHAIIQGAKLGIYDQDGTLLAEGITDKNGCVVFHNLVVGKTYQYKEIEPPSGYVLDSTMYTFTITDNYNIQCTGQIIEIDGISYIAIYNQPIQPEWPLGVDVTIYKKDSITKRILQGAVIGLYDASGNAIIIDGKAITATTDASGKAIFKGLKPGTYQYKEVTAPNGYQINEEKYYFTVQEDGSILFRGNTNGIIYDELITIDVPVYKIDLLTKAVIKGAKLGVYDENENLLAEGITDENGRVVFHNLVVGKTYQYKEIEPPEGYELNDTMYSFSITNDTNIQCYGEMIEINGVKYIAIYDTPIEKLPEELEVDVPIYKIDLLTKAILQGAKLGVYDENGNFLAEGITDENGRVVFHNLVVGRTYQYKEIEAPEGYVLNDTMYTFTIVDDKNIQCTGQIIEIDGIRYIAIYNKPIESRLPEEPDDPIVEVNVSIYKKDITTKQVLAGAVIGLYDASGKAIEIEGKAVTVTTDASGKAVFQGLKPGVYQYKEEIAPEGYRINQNKYTFTVNQDGIVIFDSAKGILYDERLEVDTPTNQNPNITPDAKLPQTGTNMVTLGISILFIEIVVGTFIEAIIYYKKKTK